MSAFTAYFDASGTEHDQLCLAVAGFVSTTDKWVEFDQRWNERLAKDGIKYFHMNEFNNPGSKGEFRNWSYDDPRRPLLHRDLIGVITDHVDRHFGCCVITEALNGLTLQERQEWHLSAYALAGRSCAAQLRLWCETWGGRVPRMVFERGDHGRGELEKILKLNKFSDPVFEPSRDVVEGGFITKGMVPLQAADLLAFELFDPARKIEKDDKLKRIRPSYDVLSRIPGSPRVIRIREMQILRSLLRATRDEIWIPGSRRESPGWIGGDDAFW
ncbi:MAG TPA: hypothetical protein DEQ47_05605 [Solibacterales bacterium]|nr:hypothetical protein [Bryobacterales bacterium]